MELGTQSTKAVEVMVPVVSHHVQMLVCCTVGSRKRTGLLGWPKSSPAGEAGIPKRLMEMLWVFLAATQPVCCFLVFCYRRQGSCPGLLLRGEKGLPWCMLLSLYRASFILLVSYRYHPRVLFLRGQLSAPLLLFPGSQVYAASSTAADMFGVTVQSGPISGHTAAQRGPMKRTQSPIVTGTSVLGVKVTIGSGAGAAAID